ncbi:hypothetical protein RFM26_04285 [Mesorhizobium sp. VK23B]|uniref:Holin n=1 Tax=Mesorhizobium dulcispinae TaxID=3072316 RepID=A0ABU4XDM6_9HYPH|nr:MULTISPECIES: hypothetical protein [unclassified Mesorhizobium]MDX8464898.1 hypothetical protein [Mesorhizobium sp. VK23B]MDX8472885.1 hypothetical protein [Mesorhizobium sp. VK23A]
MKYLADTIWDSTIVILLFGAVCLCIQLFLLARSSADAEAVMRNTTVTLVVTLGTCAVTLGFHQDTIAPIIGLFGTIIGFLLGQKTAETRSPFAADQKAVTNSPSSEPLPKKSE